MNSMSIDRSAVWFCWGAKYLEEACRSARSVSLHRILICPESDFELVPEAAAVFDQYIVANDINRNLLDKSRLLDYLPDDDRVYVFLDTDTTILEDLDWGFRKAEQHGIAVCTAPHYNLSEFWGFGEVLDKVGRPRADQNQFNTGVIFFRPTPDVRRVFSSWKDLCRSHGHMLENDQPFFSLALDMEGVLPYVLSIAYNFRGSFFEKQVGKVRIWHDPGPVPESINRIVSAWPPKLHSIPSPSD